MSKTFIVRRERTEEEKKYGTGEIVLEVSESDLDFFIQKGWRADSQRVQACCEPCQTGCACATDQCPCV